MPVKKGYKRPVGLVRLVIGETFTAEHAAALALADRLHQTVTARLSSADSVILEARPT